MEAVGPPAYDLERHVLEDRLFAVAIEVHRRNGDQGAPEAVFERLGAPAVIADLQLLLAFRAGHPQAHHDLLAAHGGWLRTLLWNNTAPDRPDEVLTTVMAHLWERSPQYLGMSKLRTWMTVVVKHWCIDQARRIQARPSAVPSPPRDDEEDSLEALASCAPSPAQSLTCREFGIALRTATLVAAGRLTPAELAFLRLRYLEGLSQEALRRRAELLEAGEECLEPYTITRRAQRASRSLRRELLVELARAGYERGDVLELLENCEGLSAEVAAQLEGA